MNPYSIQAEGIGMVQAEMGAECPVVTINRVDYNVLPGSAMYNQPLREGGFSQIYDLSFTLLLSQFSDLNLLPGGLRDALLNKPMTYLGTAYKIANLDILAGATIIKIMANSLNQNA